jgi:thiamine biosynthesis protein ThiC
MVTLVSWPTHDQSTVGQFDADIRVDNPLKFALGPIHVDLGSAYDHLYSLRYRDG